MHLFHVTPTVNIERIAAQGLTPMIGPRSQALGEPIPRIYLFTTREAMEDGVMNWLGDEFEKALSLVVIDASVLEVEINPDLDFEACIRSPIPPSLILEVSDL